MKPLLYTQDFYPEAEKLLSEISNDALIHLEEVRNNYWPFPVLTLDTSDFTQALWVVTHADKSQTFELYSSGEYSNITHFEALDILMTHLMCEADKKQGEI